MEFGIRPPKVLSTYFSEIRIYCVSFGIWNPLNLFFLSDWKLEFGIRSLNLFFLAIGSRSLVQSPRLAHFLTPKFYFSGIGIWNPWDLESVLKFFFWQFDQGLWFDPHDSLTFDSKFYFSGIEIWNSPSPSSFVILFCNLNLLFFWNLESANCSIPLRLEFRIWNPFFPFLANRSRSLVRSPRQNNLERLPKPRMVGWIISTPTETVSAS